MPAMSQENVEIVRRTVDAYASGDIEAALLAYDPDVEFDVSTARPEGGVFHGPRGVEEGVQAWVGRWAEYRFEVEDIIDAGDHVLMVIREFGRGEQSRVEVNQHTFWVNTFRNGKIVRAELFRDRNRALKAAGLKE
jgi:ketosteroid isomerase-like protein